MTDPGIHIHCTCPHCGKDARIRHDDLMRMMNEMASVVAAHSLANRAEPGNDNLSKIAAHYRAAANRWYVASMVAFYFVAALSVANAGYTFMVQQASPAVLILANLTTALACFILAGYGLPFRRRAA